MVVWREVIQLTFYYTHKTNKKYAETHAVVFMFINPTVRHCLLRFIIISLFITVNFGIMLLPTARHMIIASTSSISTLIALALHHSMSVV